MQNLPAVITPTIAGREELLVECCESVKAQTVACAHHVWLDTEQHGPALVRNTIMQRIDSEYVAFLDDDDLIDPGHLHALLDELERTGADLTFSRYRSVGAVPQVERVPYWSDYAWGVMLGGRNLIPVTVVARREAVIAAGGFWPTDRYEDYSLWMRMLKRGAHFTHLPVETWTYRMLGGNRTHLPA